MASVLIACEKSQVVCKAFRSLGHDAYSCDILPCEGGHPEWHIHGDVLNHLHDWDLMIAHPERPSGALVGQSRRDAREVAISFFMKLASCSIKHIAIENPVGIMSTVYRKPDQIIHPYHFGHDASEATCLWLKNLPLLVGSEYVEPRLVNNKKRWGNQCDLGGQDNLPPSADRSALRSRTYEGIAKAFAEQWGSLL